MLIRCAGAVGAGLVLVGLAAAQPAPMAGGAVLSQPPLLPVPSPESPVEVPRPGPAPGVEYDPGYLYLPDRAPPRAAARGADGCGPGGRWWVDTALGLSWVPRSSPPAPLRLRFGDGAVGPVLPVQGRNSGRFDAALGLALGRWFGEGNREGVEASFFLRAADRTFEAFVPGAVVVVPRGRGRPQIVVVPDALAGQFSSVFPVTLSTFYTTADVNYRSNLYCDPDSRLDALVGYRFAYLSDELFLGDVPDDRDGVRRNRAEVSNPFHGAQVGLAGEHRFGGGWYVAGAAKVAFGVVSPEARATGLFVGAEGRSFGRFRRVRALDAGDESEFAVMPVLDVMVGRQVSERARVYAGYSFQYLSRVGRLGDALNPSAGGLALTDFWVQSLNLGLELRF